jgi:uncharacterized protein DUF4154
MARRPHKIVSVLAMLLLMSGATCAAAERSNEDAARADQLKAAYLFNFVKFVEWPNTKPDETIVVCFVGATALHDAFGVGVSGKKAGSHPVAARRIEPTDNARDCSVLYINAPTLPACAALLAGETTAPLLTVSDASGFARGGGMIELFADKNRLRFNINLDNARRATLRISSSLLQLAASVEKAGAS